MVYKGMCYEPFPPGYDPSTANNSWLFFGSDIAQDAMAPLWGASFTSSSGSSCGAAAACRNDLQVLASLGANLIRLYDWEPRNPHLAFLDRCTALGIKVLAPVSNYFLQDGFAQRQTLIPALIASFSNAAGNGYHPALGGVIIANEPQINQISAQTVAAFTNDWLTLEPSGYQPLPISHPVSFGTFGGALPGWNFWDALIPALSAPAQSRLFLAPQTYNDGSYLFQSVGGSSPGWVDQTWQRYQKPILFTEIGMNRTVANHQATVQGQLQGCLAYAGQHPERLLGACFFQFADKVWMPGTSEGSFGIFEHSAQTLCSITYGAKDFTHWDTNNGGSPTVTMNVDVLQQSDLYATVAAAYATSALTDTSCA